MEIQRAMVPPAGGDGRAGAPRIEVERVAGGGEGGSGTNGTTGRDSVSDLTKRRHANDPAMMRELKRYQNIMLLTLLPSITGEADHAHQHAHRHQDTNGDAAQRRTWFGDHEHVAGRSLLPRPEATDGFPGVAHQPQAAARRSPQKVKSAGSQDASDRAEKPGAQPSGSASAGTRLPMTVHNPLETSPRRKGKKKNSDEGGGGGGGGGSRRRRSHEEWRATEDFGEAAGAGEGTGGNTTELDLLTLAALYLESRHRVFGNEWHRRPESISNTRPTAQIGNTGIARPRRLTPLSSEPSGVTKVAGEKKRYSFSGVIPAPAGLHLSVNYTQNLDLDESMYMAERARALRPRLRRLNSMDDIMPTPLSTPNNPPQRVTSAPDLSQSHNGRQSFAAHLFKSSSSPESISPPLVTPARANTPTEAKHSAALVRPQIVGGSLATYSAVEDASPPRHAAEGPERIAVGEAARNILSKGSRSLGPPPPEPSAVAIVVPGAESLRKGGRVHLQPLMKKTSR
ncbi:uncharacterized protein LOC134763466 [Penaeus indicus]|uniref:uncharacterized protein LOC134763466 n=1 Tax=Penaeus indicus TaxID=29960 RepID=UPI00300C8173